MQRDRFVWETSVERYDPDTNTWVNMAPMIQCNNFHCPSRFLCLCCLETPGRHGAILNGKAYIFREFHFVQVNSITTDTWSTINFYLQTNVCPTTLSPKNGVLTLLAKINNGAFF